MQNQYVQRIKTQYERIKQASDSEQGQDAGYNAKLWKIPQLKNPPQDAIKTLSRILNPTTSFQEHGKLQCLSFTALLLNDLPAAWAYAQNQLRLAVKILDNACNTNWFLPLIYSGIELTKAVAAKHDETVAEGTAVNTVMTDLLALLRAIKRNANKAKPELSQKQGTFFIINQLLKLSFLTDQLSYCKHAILAVKEFLPEINSFPTSHVVEFQYYSGKMQLFQENYNEAKKDLERALELCHANSGQNKIRILEILIPINLLFGIFPQPQLFAKYPIPHLQGIVKACEEGNVAIFHQELETHQRKFIEIGVFLLVTLLEPLCYRKLLAKAMAIQKRRIEAKEINLKSPSIIALSVLLSVLQVEGTTIDLDELECILANLIWKGYVKGYIAHGSKAVVLAKKDAFPDLQTNLKLDR